MGQIVTAPRNVYWKTQTPVDYLDTTLTINTFEEVVADLSGGKPAKLWYIIIEQTNNGATAEDVSLEITINGTAYSFDGTLASGAINYGYLGSNLSGGDFQPLVGTGVVTVLAGKDVQNAIPFTAESVGLIRVKQTTDVDVVSTQIEVNVVWDKLTVAVI